MGVVTIVMMTMKVINTVVEITCKIKQVGIKVPNGHGPKAEPRDILFISTLLPPSQEN